MEYFARKFGYCPVSVLPGVGLIELTKAQSRMVGCLRVPWKLRLELWRTSHGQGGGLHREADGISSIAKFLCLCRCLGNNGRSPAEEGLILLDVAAEDWVFVGVRKDISFAYRIGVGTVWRTASTVYFPRTARRFFARLLQAVD